jgi:hypothetical protein
MLEERKKPQNLDDYQLNVIVARARAKPDLKIIIKTDDPTLMLELGTRVVTALKDHGLNPRVVIIP